jgi:hypothetical protein
MISRIARERRRGALKDDLESLSDGVEYCNRLDGDNHVEQSANGAFGVHNGVMES